MPFLYIYIFLRKAINEGKVLNFFYFLTFSFSFLFYIIYNSVWNVVYLFYIEKLKKTIHINIKYI
jgi:hypothetical protein